MVRGSRRSEIGARRDPKRRKKFEYVAKEKLPERERRGRGTVNGCHAKVLTTTYVITRQHAVRIEDQKKMIFDLLKIPKVN